MIRKTKIFVTVLLILCTSQLLVYADNPITNSTFYNAYEDIPEVKKALKQGILDEELADFLLDVKRPLGHAAAVINALSWDFEGKNNSQYLVKYLTKQDDTFPKRLERGEVSGRILFVLGYLRGMDNYFEVSQAAKWLANAKTKIPESFTVSIIYAIVEGQVRFISGKTSCDTWEFIKDSIDAFPGNRDMRKDAVKYILNYMELYKKSCNRLGNPIAKEFGPDHITGSHALASFKPYGHLSQERTYRAYVVRTYQSDDGDASLEILKGGSRVYAADGYRFEIGSIYEGDKVNSLISIGSDITGDGFPNLVVSEWTGGAHCCFYFHVFEIGHRFRHIQTINVAHADLADFENVDDNPALEFPMSDWTFVYWRTCFADSPAPPVILKFQGQKYEMACDLMRKLGLSHDELNSLAAEIKTLPEWKSEQPPVRLWSEMLDLIYTGNMLQAWKLVDHSWPKGITGKQEFMDDFKERLQESPFWEDVQKLNKGI